MSALLNCAQTAGAVNKNIAKVNFPRIIVFSSKLRRTPTWVGAILAKLVQNILTLGPRHLLNRI
jgi:hypothetical protein